MSETTLLKSVARVVVTGMGIISPVGSNLKDAWRNILAGKSGIRPITDYDASELAVRFRGSVADFEVERYFDVKEARKMDTFIHYGVAAGIDAINDSGLDFSDEALAERTGIIIGSGIGGLPGVLEGYKSFLEQGPRRVSPFYVPKNIINMISGNLSIRYGIKGPNLATATACATGTHSIAQATRMIQMGDAEVMIAGGAEMAGNAMGIAGFAAAKALSTRNDDPQAASRPWDKDRDGFVLGDGAGVLVLETLERAQARGATIYGEVAGIGMSADAYHMTAPLTDGSGAARCMSLALRDAALNPQDIDYINAHGTSTPAGDTAETLAVKRAFGEHAYDLAISSTKSMTGHALGAAGGLEAVFSLLALRDQVAPPTINLDNPGEDCDLNYVAHQAQERPIRAALSNSFGFGGTNASLVFKTV
ncbi:beta-ketoacyl-ACP synthase II [Suttonella sp. R2A3]|uniref:beta-ketoacyl-ACP synthase II n=1 Tax=Suttonella sp. R2A3 TaxID=2908648 RepID=UPI001F267DAC|nr:beta-ketoacyl-ACP synthase II [Suttonella sp. R2A3]UJF24094.1 beta-ketoacyl-ACP synthase II [Suttonella sp. R2A3]